jgi:hypothetical protein
MNLIVSTVIFHAMLEQLYKIVRNTGQINVVDGVIFWSNKFKATIVEIFLTSQSQSHNDGRRYGRRYLLVTH